MRKSMVTRTFQTTRATVMCLDIEAGESVTRVLTLPRTYKDSKKLLKACEEAITEENVKAVHVVDTEVIETLYGMEEQKFIENAIAIPKKNAEN